MHLQHVCSETLYLSVTERLYWNKVANSAEKVEMSGKLECSEMIMMMVGWLGQVNFQRVAICLKHQ